MTKEKYIDESWKETAAREKEQWDKLNKQKKDSAENPNIKSQKSPLEDQKIQAEDPIEDDEESKQLKDSDQKDTEDESSYSQQEAEQINFLSYITSLSFQALVFLGQIPNPVTNEMDTNFDQAKLLIDTLCMLKEKTKGNLTQQENDLLNNSVYELQMKYVEILKKN